MDSDKEEEKEEELESESEELEIESEEEIKKVGSDTNDSLAFYPPPAKKKGNKVFFIILAVILIALIGGFLLRSQIKSLILQEPKPTPTPIATPAPTPTPNPLVRSEWGLEVLNGTTTPGQAKKLADKLTALGYPVIKTGNADKQSYDVTQILVKKGLFGKVDLVIADLGNTVKIASVAGELKEGTASARIIIGKDLTP